MERAEAVAVEQLAAKTARAAARARPIWFGAGGYCRAGGGAAVMRRRDGLRQKARQELTSS